MTNFTEADVLEVIRQEVERTSLTATARKVGVSVPFIFMLVNGKKTVSKNVASAFGFERVTVFRKTA